MRAEVNTLLNSYPESIRHNLLALRQIILDVADETKGVGQLYETLKWNQISYLTPVTRSGSTIRIDAVKNNPEQVALLFNCKTTLVETFKSLYLDTFEFEGNRCVKLDINNPEQVETIRHCIMMALTYHQSKG